DSATNGSDYESARFPDPRIQSIAPITRGRPKITEVLRMPFNPHTSLRTRSLCRALFTLIICASLAPVMTSFAQTKWGSQETHELQIRPIYVTTRVFQIKAKQGSYEDLSGQVFKMKTARLTEYENWLNAFKKTYPGFDAALLRTDSKRVFRTARPTIISLG